MIRLLRKICPFHEGEGKKVFFFSLLGFLLQAGVAIGYVGSDSLFISYLGVQNLPYIYFLLPLCMFFVTPFVSFMTQRVGVLRMQLLACFLLVLGGVGMYGISDYAIQSGGAHNGLFFVVKLYSAIWYITVYTIYWNFVDAYFDILSAKRLFPLLSGANTIGSTTGGFLVTLFMALQISVSHLFLLWGGLVLVGIVPVLSLKGFSPLIFLESEASSSVGQQIVALGRGFKKSKYVVFLTMSSFIGMILAYICEFQYMQVFETQYPSEETLANMLGYLFMMANIFNTFVVLVLFNRLIVNFGVRNIAVIQPIAYLISFIGYVAVFGSPESMLAVAIIGFFAYQGVQTSIEYNNFNLIINPIPRDIKTSVRTLIEGWIEPIGAAAAGLTLITFSQYLGFSHLEISIIALGIGSGYLAAILMLRSQYADATIQSLRDEWLDFNVNVEDAERRFTPDELKSLHNVIHSNCIEPICSACRMLWRDDHLECVTLLMRLWQDGDGASRAAYSRLLSEMYSQNDNDVNRLILDWIISQDDKNRRLIVRQLDQQNLASANTMLEMLQSSDLDARASASTLLWKHWDIEFASFAVREFQQMMHGGAKQRLAALRSLINTGDSRYAQYLKGYIDDDDEGVRKAASLALAQLVDSRNRNLIYDVTQMLHDEDAELHLAVFEALKRINDSACIPILLEHADFCTPYERRQAQQVILHLGLKSIPTCVRVLKNETISYAGRSIAARAVAQMAFPQMQSLAPALVESEIRRAYQMIYCNLVLHEKGGHQNGVTALGYFYQDEQIRSLGFILEILSLGGQIANHEMIAASLWSSSQNTRSNAIETLEQSVSKSVYKKLLPLVDGRPRASQVEFYRKNFKSETMTLDQVVEFAWNSSNPLEKTIAIQSKFEHLADGEDPSRESASQLLQSLCEKLKNAEEMVRTVLTDMVKKLDVGSVDSVVDRLVCIKQTELFSAVPVFELQRLAQKMKRLEFQAGDAIYQIGDPAHCFYVIQDGRVKLKESGPSLTTGNVFGGGVITGILVREETAAAQTPINVYQLLCDDLAESGKIYSNLSIRLHSIFALK